MGCNSSAVQVCKPTRENIKPGFGAEEYSWQRHPTLLESRRLSREAKFDAKRRKPVLAVPLKVIAPFSGELEDTGRQDYGSMQDSCSFRYYARSQGAARFNVIDDFDEPPNHETTEEYVKMLEFFMWDVSCHPRELKARIAELRGEMTERTLLQETIWELQARITEDPPEETSV